MSVGPAVTSAQTTIERVWPQHAGHKSGTRHARWSTAEGIVCACGDVLGWPDPDHHETYSQYTKRIAAEQVDAASAPGRVKGAFGTYDRPAPEPEDGEPATVLPGGDNAPEPDDYPESEVQEPPRHDDDPGPEEPGDAVDWGEPPADEPEPEVLTIDGDQPADEAQAVPWDGTGDRPERWQDSDGIGWVPPEGATAQEIADAGLYPVPPGEVARSEREWSEEGKRAYAEAVVRGNREDPFVLPDEAQTRRMDDLYAEAQDAAMERAQAEKPSSEGIGSAVVPYAGTPIMPTAEQELDPLTGRLAPLDPTQPYTPADVELKIVEILRQLENSELFLRMQLARLHQATHNHDFRYNLAIRKSDQRAADQRKADAWLATEQERREMTEAEMLVRALRDSQHNLRAQLSGFQSVARSLAVSMVNALDGRERPPLPPEPPRWN